MQVKISKTQVDRMTAGQILADKEVKGFVARKLDSGAVTYGYRYRDKMTGKQRWLGLGLHGNITADKARDLAKKAAGEVANKQDPVAEIEEARAEAKKEKAAAVNTVNNVLDAFVKRHASNLRSAAQIEHAFDTYVRPTLGAKSIYDVKRSEIVTMLDSVEDEAGPVMADRVLAHVRKAFNWQAARDDEFKSPIVRGMARTKPKERARKRALTDEEIRDVWKALETADVPVCYPRYVKSLLVTATRRNESSEMNSAEIDGDLWTIPGERYKTKLDHVVPLTDQAKALIGAKPEGFKGNSWFVFSTTEGKRPFSGFSKAKKDLDAEIAKIRKAEKRDAMPRWTLHDLRRTARSLMSRAKVPADHAERVLGHVIGGVRETYDRYEYLDEKRDALEKLAGLIELILKPPVDNVVQFEAAK
ncbi:tyrosine-type recombinase/integrase [Bradyrhizobium elkanii]|uniref:tyrosine-type recombinase/integrase n=1 Tax=Bradyrhizobium elkanii TaxID=29448 RepID=UPI00216808A5|nr:site-specific integrase [Bradyrhizobium elkanii]MCS3517082.1 integrase [Bradyrhizobium elkanii]MCS4073639.1 integrase [Bradyrhizobium elkanii]MCS4080272.1 integrase [Bradyrhizobium elkanii]MDH6691865.1 integrase [Bradyrhizobium elkanii]